MFKKKLREFRCLEYNWKCGDVTYTHVQTHPDSFLVREVSTELDAAIEKMVEALKYISGDLTEDPESIALDSMPLGALQDSIKVAREALAEWERVRGK